MRNVRVIITVFTPDDSMDRKGGICGVILAAGESRRFGADKLLARHAERGRLALAALRPFKEVLEQVVVVVRGNNAALERILEDEDVAVIRVENSVHGMGHSLAGGIASCREAAGWIIGLADMPYVSAPSLARLAEALKNGAQTVAPYYQGKRGNPVGFSHRLLDELLAMKGDVGARHLLERYPPLPQEVEDPGVLIDIDTPEALRIPLAAHIARLAKP